MAQGQKTQGQKNVKIGIVIPAYNEEGNLAELCQQISKSLDKIKIKKYEILIVDDGSKDNTLKEIKKLAKKNNYIKYISFSRNFGHQAALRAGIEFSSGDAVISMDADLQHPPRLLHELIKYWQQGYDIVYTRRQSTAETGFMKRLTSKLFYQLLSKLSGLEVDEGTADFRLIDAKVAAVIRNSPETNLFLRGFMSWCGFKTQVVEYRPDSRLAGTSKYSAKKMIALGLNGITQFSIKPLRLASFLGLVFALLGAIYGLYLTWLHLYTKATISGWTSLIVIVLFMGGIQLVILGIIGEYLGRTFMQTKQRPDYIIKEQG